MASMDLASMRHDPEEVDFAFRARALFVLWAIAMRLLSWRQAMRMSRSGETA